MSDHVTSLRWLGNHLDADAADKGIGQGSEGARICWAAATEIESLRQQLAAMEDKYLVERGMLRLKRAELADSQKQVTLLRESLASVLATRKAEAIASMALANASENFTDPHIEEAAFLKAANAASNAEKLATEALDATEPSPQKPTTGETA